MAAAAELCNGERLVVFLFMSTILYSTPLALASECAATILLALAGLAIEISAERSPANLARFKTRLGASSGILLGTVTLPTLMLSRLIQFSRALAGFAITNKEFEYARMQYWSASMSCLGILIFLYLIMLYSSKNAKYHLFSPHVVKLNLFLILYTYMCCTSLVKKSYRGSMIAMVVSWFALHGLASVGVLQQILHVFPGCASIGEVLLVASGFVLYFGDMITHTLAKIKSLRFCRDALYPPSESRREITTIIQGVLVGLLLLPGLYRLLVNLGGFFATKMKFNLQLFEGRISKEIRRSTLFYVSVAIMLTIVSPAWMQFIQDFQVHPILWVLYYLLNEPRERLLLCIYWVGIICLSVWRFYKVSKHSRIERILLRKYYHLVAVVMFSPALVFQPRFLDLAFGVAFAVFLVLEMIRVWKIWPIGNMVDRFMNAFTDHRDSDVLIISHFSLLLGCALPKWMSSGYNDRPLAPFAGILSLGIGDTMASVVGHKYGVLRWSKSGKKTYLGTAAGIASVLAACIILLPHLASTGYILSQHWVSLPWAVIVSGLLEAHTAQLDNAFIPLVFYSLLCL